MFYFQIQRSVLLLKLWESNVVDEKLINGDDRLCLSDNCGVGIERAKRRESFKNTPQETQLEACCVYCIQQSSTPLFIWRDFSKVVVVVDGDRDRDRDIEIRIYGIVNSHSFLWSWREIHVYPTLIRTPDGEIRVGLAGITWITWITWTTSIQHSSFEKRYFCLSNTFKSVPRWMVWR